MTAARRRQGFHPLSAVLLLLAAASAMAHPETLPQTDTERRLAGVAPLAREAPLAAGTLATLRLRWRPDESGRAVGGLVRITPLEGDNREPLALAGLFERPAGWFSTPPEAVLMIPAGRHRVEAVRGLETTVETHVVECLPDSRTELTLAPAVFHAPRRHGWQAVNTHLHLLLDARLKMGVHLRSRREADDYLRTVCASDGLDLVYVSYLTAPGMEILSNDYTATDLEKLSSGGVRFADGIEHRHGGMRVRVEPAPAVDEKGRPAYASDDSRVIMSYGHVLLLGLTRDRLPASIGPGMAEDPAATDGVPLRSAMQAAREETAAVVWCHGSQGLEWIPSWFGGLLHAQNIYDGGNEGTFDTVHYPLLNAGLRVPFSTGTDWGVWDFSRVYVRAAEPLTHRAFLEELAAGRTFITNEPFLEFTVNDSVPGDTIGLAEPAALRIRGRAVGRSDFIRLQLVRNGAVVHEVPARSAGGHFEAEMELELPVAEPGWLALRVPPEMPYSIRSRYTGRGVNILGKAVFAHTSPVYVTLAGRSLSDPAAVAQLIARLDTALRTVETHGSFRDEAGRDSIRRIYLEARTALQKGIESGR